MKYKAGDYVLYDDGIEYLLHYIEKCYVDTYLYYATLVDANIAPASYIGRTVRYTESIFATDPLRDYAFDRISQPSLNSTCIPISNLLWDIYNQHAESPTNIIFGEPSNLSEKHKCTCVLFDVMNYGCKCGGV